MTLLLDQKCCCVEDEPCGWTTNAYTSGNESNVPKYNLQVGSLTISITEDCVPEGGEDYQTLADLLFAHTGAYLLTYQSHDADEITLTRPANVDGVDITAKLSTTVGYPGFPSSRRINEIVLTYGTATVTLQYQEDDDALRAIGNCFCPLGIGWTTTCVARMWPTGDKTGVTFDIGFSGWSSDYCCAEGNDSQADIAYFGTVGSPTGCGGFLTPPAAFTVDGYSTGGLWYYDDPSDPNRWAYVHLRAIAPSSLAALPTDPNGSPNWCTDRNESFLTFMGGLATADMCDSTTISGGQSCGVQNRASLNHTTSNKDVLSSSWNTSDFIVVADSITGVGPAPEIPCFNCGNTLDTFAEN